jgi:hypothetical protein
MVGNYEYIIVLVIKNYYCFPFYIYTRNNVQGVKRLANGTILTKIILDNYGHKVVGNSQKFYTKLGIRKVFHFYYKSLKV